MKITFRKNIEGKTRIDILNDFKANFESTNCDKIRIIGDNQLFIENKIVRFKSRQNLWGGIGNANLTIKDSIHNNIKEVYYKIDFSKYLVISFFLIILSYLFLINDFKDEEMISSLFLYILFPAAMLVNFLIILIRHYSFFIRTIKKGSIYVGDYKWENILKNKTDNELKIIISGQSHLSKAVGELARKELSKRGVDGEDISTVK